MLDHVTLGVGDIERSRKFYDQALRPLGIERLYAEGETASGYGAGRKAFFWISLREASQTGAHVAFTTEDRETVDRYHQDYYGAFVLDPDGHNIEAVCRRKQV
jgi:catechol 2,3-dioxygenase-like lactoylglutathione lyase family enzyme